MHSVLAILTGTPLWVWGVLVLIVYLGVAALHPGRRSPVCLSLAPGIFLTVALGALLTSTRLGEILPLWLTGCLLGIGIGAAWAMVLRIGIDRSQGIISMPGTAFWLVTGIILFGMRYSIEVYLAFNRNLAQEPLWVFMPYIIVGLGAGMSVGWWAALMMRYFRTT